MPSAKKRKVLDSWAMLAYLQGEPSAGKVRDLLADANAGKTELLMCMLNLGEVYYVLVRELGEAVADARLTAIKQLPVQFVAVTEELILAAAKVEADLPIALADCFAIATAALSQASVVTGDREFAAAENRVDIEWL